MKFSGLRQWPRRRKMALPGVVGTARVERRPGEVVRRINAGEIAIVNHADLDRRTAEGLVAAGAAGIVNVATSISGRFPNLGPAVLLEAGIVLIDDVGTGILQRIKDGATIRLHDGGIFVRDREIARGKQQDANSVADHLIEAKAGIAAQLEAFSANTIDFLRTERSLLLDRMGVPDLTVSMEERHVVVVAPGPGHTDDLRKLKRYIKEHRPVLIGVDAAADSLHMAGYRPDIIVGNPEMVAMPTLLQQPEVVIPARLDGNAPGLQRIQDIGIGAVTFPASGNPEDLALLLADVHGASVVVTVGSRATLHEFLDRGRAGTNPSTFLTRLRLGSKIMDGAAVARLLPNRIPVGAVAVPILLAALAGVAFIVSGHGEIYLDLAEGAANSLVAFVRGLLP